MKNTFRLMLCISFFAFSISQINAQTTDDLQQQIEGLNKKVDDMQHTFDVLNKNIDDLLWFQRIGDVAFVDKVYIYGPPKWKEENPNAQGAGNPVKFWTYVIIPKNIDPDKKIPADGAATWWCSR